MRNKTNWDTLRSTGCAQPLF